MVTVLASSDIKQFISPRIKTYSESHGRISFNMHTSSFATLINNLRAKGINPYAVMQWEEI